MPGKIHCSVDAGGSSIERFRPHRRGRRRSSAAAARVGRETPLCGRYRAEIRLSSALLSQARSKINEDDGDANC
jgi:hypothetical protein